MASRSDLPELNRRKLLGMIGMGGAVGLAGCIGDDDDEEPTPTPTPTDQPTRGGRLQFGVERIDISDYDYADSSLADDSMIFAAIFDGLRAQGPDGTFYNWMAEEYGAVDAQDVSNEDYAPYMSEREIVDIDAAGIPAYDVEWPNTALLGRSNHHPDTLAGIADGDIDVGDMGWVLTREDAADAVADGVFGVAVEGRLHEGITFHNGEECTAEHVVRAYDRWVGSTNHGQVFDSILHAEATGEYSFALYAQEADAIAEAALPVTIVPLAHTEIPPGEGLDPRDGGEIPIGTGPYQIEEVADNTLVLTRYDDYWLEQIGVENKEWFETPDWWDEEWGDFPSGPLIEEINCRFVPEGPTRAAAMSAREVDLTYELSAESNLGFEADPNFSVHAATSTGFKFMSFPIHEDGPVWKHQGARQAAARLIPRQDIINFIEQGYGTPANQYLPEPASGLGSHMSFDELQNADWAWPADPDPEAAAEWLDETPLEPPIEVEVHTNADDEVRQDKMAIVVDEWNASGLFEATLVTPADIGVWISGDLWTEQGDINYATGAGPAGAPAVAVYGLAAGFDPWSYFIAAHHPASYNGCCNNFLPPGSFDWQADLDEPRFSPAAAEDPDARRDMFDDLHPRMANDCGTTLVDFSDEVTVAGPRLNGYDGYPDRRANLTHGLYAPYQGTVAWLEE